MRLTTKLQCCSPPTGTIEEALEAIRLWAPPVIAALNTEFEAICREHRVLEGGDGLPPTREEVLPPVVFLGGACNPTTWRKDIAMPFLNRHNISYYNPQVGCPTMSVIVMSVAKKEDGKPGPVFRPALLCMA